MHYCVVGGRHRHQPLRTRIISTTATSVGKKGSHTPISSKLWANLTTVVCTEQAMRKQPSYLLIEVVRAAIYVISICVCALRLEKSSIRIYELFWSI